MIVIENKIEECITDELENAMSNHEPFHSEHEAWAVLTEEYDEAYEETNKIECSLSTMWHYIKSDCHIEVREQFEQIREFAKHLAEEACQICAVCDKAEAYYRANEKR